MPRTAVLARFPRSLAAIPVAALLTLSICGPSPASADDGDLDPTFGSSGRAVHEWGTARAVLAREDGSLRVAISRHGQVGFLALEPDGSLDTSFGEGGFLWASPDPGADTILPVALFERPDGRLLMVASSEETKKIALVQVTADGDLDPDFGVDGIALRWHNANWTWPLAAVLQSNGKVLLAGSCFNCGPSTSADTMLVRVGETGSIDTTFGDNGWVIFDADESGTEYDQATALAFDTAGKIVIAGRAGTVGEERPYVARRLANGDADLLFGGGNGILTLHSLPLMTATSLQVDPESKRILVATTDFGFSPEAAVARVTAGGILDDEFGDGGIVTLDFEEGSKIRQIRLQSDRKIVGVGSVDANGVQQEGFLLVRLLADGTLDPSFDGNGRKHVEFDLEPNARDYALAMTLSGGRIVAVGTAIGAGPSANIALARTTNALVFSDGFERGNTQGWNGN